MQKCFESVDFVGEKGDAKFYKSWSDRLFGMLQRYKNAAQPRMLDQEIHLECAPVDIDSGFMATLQKWADNVRTASKVCKDIG